jgi:hypothetical protein
MPMVLEYTTSRSVGRFRLAADSPDSAMTKASSALRGLQCLNARLLLSDGDDLFSHGSVIATYTLTKGWRVTEAVRE